MDLHISFISPSSPQCSSYFWPYPILRNRAESPRWIFSVSFESTASSNAFPVPNGSASFQRSTFGTCDLLESARFHRHEWSDTEREVDKWRSVRRRPTRRSNRGRRIKAKSSPRRSWQRFRSWSSHVHSASYTLSSDGTLIRSTITIFASPQSPVDRCT